MVIVYAFFFLFVTRQKDYQEENKTVSMKLNLNYEIEP